ncbi:hypothetical protein Efla_004140 [Eimeria flavescens]
MASSVSAGRLASRCCRLERGGEAAVVFAGGAPRPRQQVPPPLQWGPPLHIQGVPRPLLSRPLRVGGPSWTVKLPVVWGHPRVSQRPLVTQPASAARADGGSLSDLEKALQAGGWFQNWRFLELFLLCTAAFGCMYTAVYWFALRPLREKTRQQDAEVNPSLVSLLGLELLAHLGPSALPELLRMQVAPEPLSQLQRQQRDGSSVLLREEQTQALGALEALTRTRAAARRLAAKYSSSREAKAMSDAAAAADPAAAADSPLLQVLLRELVHETAGSQQQQSQPPAAAEAAAAEATAAAAPEEKPECRYSPSQWASLLRVLFRVLQITPLQERRVAYEDLAGLVSSNEALWKLRLLFREAQALLVYRLLQCESNCQEVLSREIGAAAKRDGDRGCEQEEEAGGREALPVLNWLCSSAELYIHPNPLAQLGSVFCPCGFSCHSASPLLAPPRIRISAFALLLRACCCSVEEETAEQRLTERIWSAEVADINKKSLLLLERAASAADREKLQALGLCKGGDLPPGRKTPPLAIKQSLQQAASAVGCVVVVAAGGALWRMQTVELTLANIARVGLAALRGIRGLCLLEGVYSAESSVIHSSRYFSDEAFMWKASAGMLFVRGAALAFVLKTHKYAVLPFLLLRLREAAGGGSQF